MIGHMEPLKKSDHRRLAVFIDEAAGIQLPEHKRSLIESRLRKRLVVTGKDNFREYLDWALTDRSEQVMLIDVLTTNKTDFFRESNHFDFLQGYLSEQIQNNSSRRSHYRFWSAGCSTGEEPYTLAIVLENLKHDYPGFQYSIEATDIAPSVLDTARRGVYSHDLVHPIPMADRKRYLLRKKTRQMDLVRIVPELRKNIRFTSFNLITGDFNLMGKFDGIFCRNVMIYFSPVQREQIIENFAAAIEMGGLFFIGHSEGLSARQFGFDSPIPTVYRKISL
ncbi:CheR family methyltransferase [Celerinatantimonas diazotrophica]|uniref:Chemotaxis protein methyltransferase n=1 Tax=Celerinatantimonas diazotrophica TaxID=412034 RepID=A0A4V2PRI7_9GAMM|nr:protein-glutamate O-methyltransferase CheR [Celerinatantimonas diazotrophica]TCK58131.1 CheR-type MCP methyltransferase [Celerinatantimonas diazotrophica]CAG9297797.1 Chemotaxis protein methyltransferase [Celerinatantimonas diazotrophica]